MFQIDQHSRSSLRVPVYFILQQRSNVHHFSHKHIPLRHIRLKGSAPLRVGWWVKPVYVDNVSRGVQGGVQEISLRPLGYRRSPDDPSIASKVVHRFFETINAYPEFTCFGNQRIREKVSLVGAYEQHTAEDSEDQYALAIEVSCTFAQYPKASDVILMALLKELVVDRARSKHRAVYCRRRPNKSHYSSTEVTCETDPVCWLPFLNGRFERRSPKRNQKEGRRHPREEGNHRYRKLSLKLPQHSTSPKPSAFTRRLSQ